MTDTAAQPGQSCAHVVVAVLTYRRPVDLATVLPLLLDQVARIAVPVEVLVVDNDPEGGARTAVNAAEGPLRYVHEPEPGIAAARNRALDEAHGAQAVVFVDDDERPSLDWLATLVGHWQKSGTAAVVGPVVSEFEVPLTGWIAAGDFFRRRRLPTGTRVEVAATNNLLLDLEWVDCHGLRFDVEFGLSGGSDTLFTRQLVQLGGTMEWNDDALVTDWVPAARSTPGWVLQRAFRSGNGWSRVCLHLSEGRSDKWRRRAALAGRGILRLGAGGARTVIGTVFCRADQQAKGMRTMARGLGMATGAYGYVYHEYRRPLDEATGIFRAGAVFLGGVARGRWTIRADTLPPTRTPRQGRSPGQLI